MKTTVYTPESPFCAPRAMLGFMFRDLWAGRELAWQLAVRNIKAQYRQTALGLLYTDVGKSLPLLLQFLMYVTPVAFSMSTSGIASIIFTLNPHDAPGTQRPGLADRAAISSIFGIFFWSMD